MKNICRAVQPSAMCVGGLPQARAHFQSLIPKLAGLQSCRLPRRPCLLPAAACLALRHTAAASRVQSSGAAAHTQPHSPALHLQTHPLVVTWPCPTPPGSCPPGPSRARRSRQRSRGRRLRPRQQHRQAHQGQGQGWWAVPPLPLGLSP